jgi:hypothetical protein
MGRVVHSGDTTVSEGTAGRRRDIAKTTPTVSNPNLGDGQPRRSDPECSRPPAGHARSPARQMWAQRWQCGQCDHVSAARKHSHLAAAAAHDPVLAPQQGDHVAHERRLLGAVQAPRPQGPQRLDPPRRAARFLPPPITPAVAVSKAASWRTHAPSPAPSPDNDGRAAKPCTSL